MGHRPFENLARDLVRLHPETVSRAEEVAKEQKTARRRPARRKPAAVKDTMSVRIAEEVMLTALRLADGDHRRVVLQKDGSAIVYNHPRGAGNSAPVNHRGR